jgi:hypothetical protein
MSVSVLVAPLWLALLAGAYWLRRRLLRPAE